MGELSQPADATGFAVWLKGCDRRRHSAVHHLSGGPSVVSRTGLSRGQGAYRGFGSGRIAKAIGIIIILWLVLFAGDVTLGAKKQPITPFPPDWPHRAPWRLTRGLLMPETPRIVFVVDVPRGSEPKEGALNHLTHIASLYGEREAVWVRLGAPEAPALQWLSPAEPVADVRITIAGTGIVSGSGTDLPLEVKDTVRYVNQVVACPDEGLSESASYVFVRYLGMWGQSYGSASEVRGVEGCRNQTFPVIYIGQDQIALHRVPVMAQQGLEARALVHEYGHVLGLGSNPAHGRWAHTIPYSQGPHCVNRSCAVAVPSARALLGGLMLDYCGECQRDIQEAKTHWRTGKEFPEAPRLPQPDPAAIVGQLKSYQFRRGGEAEKLVDLGKVILPALVDRLGELPGTRQSSPRCVAALFVKRIIIAEQDARQEVVGRYRDRGPKEDCAGGLGEWWEQERQAFMAGDEWEFPFNLLSPVVDDPVRQDGPE